MKQSNFSEEQMCILSLSGLSSLTFDPYALNTSLSLNILLHVSSFYDSDDLLWSST